MRKYFAVLRICGAAVTFLLGSHSLMAQSTGHLKGRVSDQLGAAIERTQLLVESPAGRFEATANENGEFDLELPAGMYRITSRKIPGFVPFTRNKVRIESGKFTVLNVKLKVTLKDAVCVLEVTAAAEKKPASNTKKK